MDVELSPEASTALCARTAEVLEALPAVLSCGGPDRPHSETPAPLHVRVRRGDGDGDEHELELTLRTGVGPPTTRRLPVPKSGLDEATLEAVASVVVGAARAQDLNNNQSEVLSSEDGAATHAEPAALPQAPQLAAQAQPVVPAPVPAPPRPQAAPAPAPKEDARADGIPSRASTDLAAGYGLSFFSPALALHGASVQLLHRRALDGGAFVVGAELSLPFARTVDRPALSARVASYVLRAVAGVQWPLTERLSLITVGGLLAQRVDARAVRTDDDIDAYSSTTHQGIGLVLGTALQVRLTEPFFVNVSMGVDLDPAMLELGVNRAGQFERLFRSNRVRASAALHVGLTL